MPIAAIVTAAAIATAPAPVPMPVQVMVLGTYHFGNPGRDKVNVRVDDVTMPRRQRELAALADAVIAFRPTKVMVEEERPGPDYTVPDYVTFTPATLLARRDEGTQIAYRIARRLGLATVQGIDEQPSGGEPDYFPGGAVEDYAMAHGQKAAFEAVFAPIRAEAQAMEATQATTSIPQMLIRYNDPATPMGGQSSYYNMLQFGDGTAQPGADLNAMWYLRNAKIFAKLVNVARPGDRILVVYGAGHGYWLRHFAAETPGYVAVDVRPYLAKAVAALNATTPAARP